MGAIGLDWGLVVVGGDVSAGDWGWVIAEDVEVGRLVVPSLQNCDKRNAIPNGKNDGSSCHIR